MEWKFELVAGPYKGRTGGLAWDGKAMLFSAVSVSGLNASPASASFSHASVGPKSAYRSWCSFTARARTSSPSRRLPLWEARVPPRA